MLVKGRLLEVLSDERTVIVSQVGDNCHLVQEGVMIADCAPWDLLRDCAVLVLFEQSMSFLQAVLFLVDGVRQVEQVVHYFNPSVSSRKLQNRVPFLLLRTVYYDPQHQ